MRYAKTRKLNLQCLEDRSVPSFSLGGVFQIGGGSTDMGGGVARDAADNIYVSGYYEGTVDFDPNGTNPGSNHVLTSTPGSSTGGAHYAAKYQSDGTFLWAADLGPITGLSSRIAVQGGSAYVSYVADGPGGDCRLAKLDAASGAVSWTITLAPGGGSSARIAPGPGDSVFVTSTNASGQAFVSKLDSAGTAAWTRTTSGGTARGIGLAVDGAGNSYVAGHYTGSVNFGPATLTGMAGTQDVFVWRLNSSGVPTWAGSMGSNGFDRAEDLALDSSGKVVVTGSWGQGSSTASQNNNFNPGSGKAVKLTNNGDADMFIVKLAPAANGSMSLTWAKSAGGSSYDRGEGIAVDGSGNVYTTGIFQSTVMNFNPNKGATQYKWYGGGFVLKLATDGKYVDVAQFGQGTSSWPYGYAGGRSIAVDGSDNAYVTGQFFNTADFDPTSGTYNLTANGGNDAFVLKLTQSALRPGGEPSELAADLNQPASMFDDRVDRIAVQRPRSDSMRFDDLMMDELFGVPVDQAASKPEAKMTIDRESPDLIRIDSWIGLTTND